MSRPIVSLALCLLACASATAFADPIDLTHATVVVRSGLLSNAEKIAPVILTEEVAKRTGAAWPITDQWPAQASAIIALSTRSAPVAWRDRVPGGSSDASQKPEGFEIRSIAAKGDQPATIFITGTDPRGLLFGVGKLLRVLQWGSGPVRVDTDLSLASAPDRPIRGHQIGYRAKANSWDAWTVEQFDQYFRDLAIFGANAIENIPFEDKAGPLMKYSRQEMNLKYSELCDKYDLDYWLWVPVLFPLPNAEKGRAFLDQQDALYRACKRLDAIFIPGGDPGDNHAKDLLPYAEQMAAVLRKSHPHATIWVSMQGFRKPDIDDFYAYLDSKRPDWFGGVVMGPSSPPMEATRRRLDRRYKLRWYPDVSHIMRCQYPVPWLDVAWSLTLGREPVNPRPVDYAGIYHSDYRFTDGFISYSDGIADDFNKVLWTQLAWDPTLPVREIAVEYARLFFRGDLAEAGGDAILGLETNLLGSLASNGSVEGTLEQWRALEKAIAQSKPNWRFDMHLFRAYYDGYTRRRLLYENDLEKRALEKLAQAEKIGPLKAMVGAREMLKLATSERQNKDLLTRINALADRLYEEIGYQTSVPKYHASRDDRGCVMDFINYPLNNRWWLEDQFAGIALVSDKSAQEARLASICKWENPGDGSYYEVLGDIGRSPHIPKLLYSCDAMRRELDAPLPTHRPTGPRRVPLRIAWHVYQDHIPPLTYTGLDPKGTYSIKLFAQRQSPLLIDGKPARLIHKGEKYDQVTEQEFAVPPAAVQDGRIVLSWAKLDQSRLNWRQYHYVTELWVLRHPDKEQPSSAQKTARNAAR